MLIVEVRRIVWFIFVGVVIIMTIIGTIVGGMASYMS